MYFERIWSSKPSEMTRFFSYKLYPLVWEVPWWEPEVLNWETAKKKKKVSNLRRFWRPDSFKTQKENIEKKKRSLGSVSQQLILLKMSQQTGGLLARSIPPNDEIRLKPQPRYRDSVVPLTEKEKKKLVISDSKTHEKKYNFVSKGSRERKISRFCGSTTQEVLGAVIKKRGIRGGFKGQVRSKTIVNTIHL